MMLSFQMMNSFMDFAALIVSGISDHIFGPRYDRVSVPYESVHTFCILKGICNKWIFLLIGRFHLIYVHLLLHKSQ